MHPQFTAFAPMPARPPCAGSPVARWAFDAQAGQIHALDSQGRLLMAIGASPWFGARLAAAFEPQPAGHDGMLSYSETAPGGLHFNWA